MRESVKGEQLIHALHECHLTIFTVVEVPQNSNLAETDLNQVLSDLAFFSNLDVVVRSSMDLETLISDSRVEVVEIDLPELLFVVSELFTVLPKDVIQRYNDQQILRVKNFQVFGFSIFLHAKTHLIASGICFVDSIFIVVCIVAKKL